MKKREDIREFLDPFLRWASAQEDIQAIGLVGSYTRGAAREDSDIDLVILTSQPQKYLEDRTWIEHFGAVTNQQTEGYEKLISVRVWYQNGPEVEYGMTVPALPKTSLAVSSIELT